MVLDLAAYYVRHPRNPFKMTAVAKNRYVINCPLLLIKMS